MSQDKHDELLAAAVQAQEDYEADVLAAKERRRLAFTRAVEGGASARGIARALGKSPAWATRIINGIL